MSLTGKTIGRLALLSGITQDTLFVVELSGITYHIPYSGLSQSSNYSSVTYSELYNLTTGGTLTPGVFYLMTDYQTCYDQPNYNNFKDPIITGNYMSGSTEPIVLISTSISGFSPTIYSTLYPQDKITYDITWNTTEITSSPAKGRITERIDEFNNRTDYDHRSILFKRYRGYSYNENNSLSGFIGVSGITGTTGVLYGNTGTTFNSNFGTGSIIAIPNLNPAFFEVISVESDSIAIISGVTISGTDNAPYYSASDDGIMSYYQPNIRQNQVYEYTTFGDAIDDGGAVNNYIGNYSNLHLEFGTGDFLLANNVLLEGSFRNNTIGNGSYNNTFNDDCDNNQIGDSFYNNSINDDFDGNIIGENFRNNYITSNFNNNRIGSDFYSNTLLGGSFYRNNIGNYFQSNDCLGEFSFNFIGNEFTNNNIQDGFGFGGSQSQGNRIGNNFNNNTIGEYFYNNTIPDNFNTNIIGNYFQWNIVDTYVNAVDFTTNYGNISGITYGATGTTATDDTYIGLSGITNGIGVNATFDVEVFGGTVIGVSGNTSGKLYLIGDTITILGTQINGTNVVDNITITVSNISQNPSVYELYTCNIFKNSALSNRLSYYDASDVLTIKNINE